ncbi:MAG TPA: acyl carrier protein [Caulobacteraceae bacterium]
MTDQFTGFLPRPRALPCGDGDRPAEGGAAALQLAVWNPRMEATTRSVRDGIAAALSQTVGRSVEISDETNIARDLGLDSLAIMNFIMALEDEYDISIPLDRVAQVETVGDLVTAIEELRSRG